MSGACDRALYSPIEVITGSFFDPFVQAHQLPRYIECFDHRHSPERVFSQSSISRMDGTSFVPLAFLLLGLSGPQQPQRFALFSACRRTPTQTSHEDQ